VRTNNTAQMEKIRKYRVPEHDGEFIADPPFGEMPEHIENNRNLIAAYDFEVAGTVSGRLRHCLRRRLNASCGGKLPEDRALIMLAHQPEFYNPGVIFKYALLEGLKQFGCTLEVVVDSDVEHNIHLKVPAKMGNRYKVVDLLLCDNGDRTVFEHLKAPPKQVLDRLLAESVELVKSLRQPQMVSAIEKFSRIVEKNYYTDVTISDLMVSCRRDYYPTPDMASIALSRICSWPEFKLFAADIIFNIERFTECYNGSLDEYRHEVHERYPANPFPNLTVDNGVFELPFWIINKDGTRGELFLDTKGARHVLLSDDREKIKSIDPGDNSALDDIQIRPKAIALTIFHRLFVADAFIHGVGGGNYDRATDKIIRRYYGVEPPLFFFSSCTRFPSINGGRDLEQHIEKQRLLLRDMKNNPDKYVDPGNKLAVEKANIIKNAAGNFTKTDYKRLSEIRKQLCALIEGDIALAQEQHQNLVERMQNIRTIQRRDFPYFIFTPEQLIMPTTLNFNDRGQ